MLNKSTVFFLKKAVGLLRKPVKNEDDVNDGHTKLSQDMLVTVVIAI